MLWSPQARSVALQCSPAAALLPLIRYGRSSFIPAYPSFCLLRRKWPTYLSPAMVEAAQAKAPPSPLSPTKLTP